MTQPELSPQQLAEIVRDRMFKEDAVAQSLEIHFEGVGSGYAKLRMTVRGDMLNGFKTCHGGFITTLADTAFAYACNSHNDATVAFNVHWDLDPYEDDSSPKLYMPDANLKDAAGKLFVH